MEVKWLIIGNQLGCLPHELYTFASITHSLLLH